MNEIDCYVMLKQAIAIYVIATSFSAAAAPISAATEVRAYAEISSIFTLPIRFIDQHTESSSASAHVFSPFAEGLGQAYANGGWKETSDGTMFPEFSLYADALSFGGQFSGTGAFASLYFNGQIAVRPKKSIDLEVVVINRIEWTIKDHVLLKATDKASSSVTFAEYQRSFSVGGTGISTGPTLRRYRVDGSTESYDPQEFSDEDLIETYYVQTPLRLFYNEELLVPITMMVDVATGNFGDGVVEADAHQTTSLTGIRFFDESGSDVTSSLDVLNSLAAPVRTNPESVPEPGSLMMTCMGLFVAISAKRRIRSPRFRLRLC
jgi:hypothetical protein